MPVSIITCMTAACRRRKKIVSCVCCPLSSWSIATSGSHVNGGLDTADLEAFFRSARSWEEAADDRLAFPEELTFDLDSGHWVIPGEIGGDRCRLSPLDASPLCCREED